MSPMESTPRPGTMAGAMVLRHSTTRGGAILATRGTTGTGTSATIRGIMTGVGDIRRMATIHTTQDLCLRTHHTIVQVVAQITSLVVVLTTALW